MVTKVGHVGIATHSITKTLEFYRLLGLEVSSVEVIEEQKVKAAMLRIGSSGLELLEATEAASPIARFLQRRGEGIHHISLEVDDLQGCLAELRAKGVTLVGSPSRIGAQGRQIAFIHPRSAGGVLVELSQSEGGL